MTRGGYPYLFSSVPFASSSCSATILRFVPLMTCRTECGREGGDKGAGVATVGGGAAVAVTSKAIPLATELAYSPNR